MAFNKFAATQGQEVQQRKEFQWANDNERGGPLQPIGAERVKEDGKGAFGIGPGATDLRQKLDEQLRRQEELQRQLAQLEGGGENEEEAEPAELTEPPAPAVQQESAPETSEKAEPSPTANTAVEEMDDEAILRALEEQRSLRRSLRARLQHLLGERSVGETAQDPQ
ncbi:unnamed protein product, partial [Symbiodinium natans]